MSSLYLNWLSWSNKILLLLLITKKRSSVSPSIMLVMKHLCNAPPPCLLWKRIFPNFPDLLSVDWERERLSPSICHRIMCCTLTCAHAQYDNVSELESIGGTEDNALCFVYQLSERLGWWYVTKNAMFVWLLAIATPHFLSDRIEILTN